HGHWPRDCGLHSVTCTHYLLGLSIATLSTVTHYGLRFTLISNVSLDSNSYRHIKYVLIVFANGYFSPQAVTVGIFRLYPQGFFCFALAFCGLIPAACWRYTHSTEVEDSMMDVYDFVYEEVRRNTSSFRRSELTAIHEAVSCLSPAAENLALGYLPKGFGRLGLTPVSALLSCFQTPPTQLPVSFCVFLNHHNKYFSKLFLSVLLKTRKRANVPLQWWWW
uniref:Tetraspanin 32 n=1 Tax=Corvus moneduloides TaxID=1196302 RepID=A0A8U7M938_CORMO